MRRPLRVLMAGGGTGGHVYPAIAIADAIRKLEPNSVVEFAGTRDRMEWQAVPKAGYAIHPITISGLQRELTLRNLSLPFKLVAGFVQSWKLVGGFDPDVVVGTGGYVSGPVLFGASLRGRPVLIQEQNAHAGITNRMLAKRAERIHIAFPEVEQEFPAGRCVLSGNPTREDLPHAGGAEARRHYDVPEDATVLLVMGGSLGSAAINAAIRQHLAELLADEGTYLIWQTGAKYYDDVRATVEDHPRLRLLKYLDRMDLAYAATDLAMCRAGAITCSELMVTGTPAILVPSPNVTADHQTKNARSMESAGAAVLLPEANLNDGLVEQVRMLIRDEKRRQAMSRAAKQIAKPEAAEEIARDVIGFAKRRE